MTSIMLYYQSGLVFLYRDLTHETSKKKHKKTPHRISLASNFKYHIHVPYVPSTHFFHTLAVFFHPAQIRGRSLQNKKNLVIFPRQGKSNLNPFLPYLTERKGERNTLYSFQCKFSYKLGTLSILLQGLVFHCSGIGAENK